MDDFLLEKISEQSVLMETAAGFQPKPFSGF
jgi:hypothetical protein